MKYIISTVILFSIISSAFSQKALLEDSAVLELVKGSLEMAYQNDFTEAEENLNKIKAYSPQHPAIPFIKAFNIYWEYFPLYPEHPKSDEFTELMEECIEKSETWLEKNPDELEAKFFDLFGRAFYIMYWADNGKSSKVFPHINTLYKHTIEGFDLKEVFNEFYFTTGLYNYYIKAYPEKHTIYKPIVKLFREGNTNIGLKQLDYCAQHAVFLRVEAKLFSSLLYLNYETDLDSATKYAAQLYNEFPENPYYTGKYLEILLLNKKYFIVPVLLDNLKKQKSDFAQMLYMLYKGVYIEKSAKDYKNAKLLYEKTLIQSAVFGDFSDQYTAVAYMGLGRISEKTGVNNKARKYFRQAKDYTAYDYILEDR